LVIPPCVLIYVPYQSKPVWFYYQPFFILSTWAMSRIEKLVERASLALMVIFQRRLKKGCPPASKSPPWLGTKGLGG
jgi:hypothetical protein